MGRVLAVSEGRRDALEVKGVLRPLGRCPPRRARQPVTDDQDFLYQKPCSAVKVNLDPS